MTVAAPAEYVWRVLTDFMHFYRLNPSIIESDILPSPKPGVARARTLARDCISFICRRIERVEDVQVVGEGQLVASVSSGDDDVHLFIIHTSLRRSFSFVGSALILA